MKTYYLLGILIVGVIIALTVGIVTEEIKTAEANRTAGNMVEAGAVIGVAAGECGAAIEKATGAAVLGVGIGEAIGTTENSAQLDAIAKGLANILPKIPKWMQEQREYKQGHC